MNFVQQFQQSDLFVLEQASNPEEVKNCLKQKGIEVDTIASLLCEIYQFATVQDYHLQQKKNAVNITLRLLKKLPSSQTREKFNRLISEEMNHLSRRNESCKQCFDLVQLSNLKQFLSEKILPYFELYQIVLDDNPHFLLQAKPSDIVKCVCENSLSTGTSVDVENVPILKEFIGIRAAKEEKKDPKKK